MYYTYLFLYGIVMEHNPSNSVTSTIYNAAAKAASLAEKVAKETGRKVSAANLTQAAFNSATNRIQQARNISAKAIINASSQASNAASSVAQNTAATKIQSLVRARQAKQLVTNKINAKARTNLVQNFSDVGKYFKDKAKETVHLFDKQVAERGWSAGRETFKVAKQTATSLEKLFKSNEYTTATKGIKTALKKAVKKDTGWSLISNKYVQKGMNYLMDMPLDQYNYCRETAEKMAKKMLGESPEQDKPTTEQVQNITRIFNGAEIDIPESLQKGQINDKEISEALYKHINPSNNFEPTLIILATKLCDMCKKAVINETQITDIQKIITQIEPENLKNIFENSNLNDITVTDIQAKLNTLSQVVAQGTDQGAAQATFTHTAPATDQLGMTDLKLMQELMHRGVDQLINAQAKYDSATNVMGSEKSIKNPPNVTSPATSMHGTSLKIPGKITVFASEGTKALGALSPPPTFNSTTSKGRETGR